MMFSYRLISRFFSFFVLLLRIPETHLTNFIIIDIFVRLSTTVIGTDIRIPINCIIFILVWNFFILRHIPDIGFWFCILLLTTFIFILFLCMLQMIVCFLLIFIIDKVNRLLFLLLLFFIILSLAKLLSFIFSLLTCILLWFMCFHLWILK